MRRLNKEHFTTLLLLLMLSTLASCVGTIKSVNPINTKTVTTETSVIKGFDGILVANPIAHNKVEIFFNPILKDIDKYSYVITYDKQQTPIYVAANSLSPDYRGYVKVTIKNLDPNTSYVFSVQVRDISNGRESANSAKLPAKTFANTTANFEGIAEARNLNGSAGLTGIEVLWPEAEILGGLASADSDFPGDPSQYVVTVINSNLRNPSDMNNESVHEPDRKVVSINATGRRSLIVSGLNPDTKYFVQVRCIQRGANITANSSNVNYRKEENTTYLEIKTYSADKASLKFQADKFALSFPPNNAGLYALKTSWIAPTGNFDHYRIYYARRYSAADSSQFSLINYLNSTDADTLCYDVEAGSSVTHPVYCQEANVGQSTSVISGLDPNTQYDVVLEVCITTACKNNDERVTSFLQTKITTPNIAKFDGLKRVDPSNDINNLNSVKLVFVAPVYASGAVDGFLVDYYPTQSSLPITLNDGSLASPPLTVEPFDYHVSCPNTDDICTMTITGIDITSTDNFCFNVYPFSYGSDGKPVPAPYKSNFLPVCPSISTLLSAPNSTEFTGLKTISCDKTLGYGKASLDWILPLASSNGLYDKFEIFYIANSNFSYRTAQSEFDAGGATSYGRFLVDRSVTSLNIINLDPTKKYTFGVNTYYNSPAQIFRSMDNSGFMSCDFPTVP